MIVTKDPVNLTILIFHVCKRNDHTVDFREDIYGFEVSEGMVFDIKDKLLTRIEEWPNRPLSAVYPIVFIDAVHLSIRDDGVIRKLTTYVVLGINEDGIQEVLIIVGENESSKYWLSVLNSLKRGPRYSHSML